MTGGALIVVLGRRAGVEPPNRGYTNWPFPWNWPPLCSRRQRRCHLVGTDYRSNLSTTDYTAKR